MPADAELLIAGDDSAFEQFVTRHHDRIARYVARRLGPTDAEEIVNDVFLTAHRTRARYDASYADALPWLLGIATNLIRRRRRVEARLLRTFAASGVDPVAPDEPPERTALSADLAGALATMNPKQRDVLFLYGIAQLTLEEIAVAMNVPVGTVKSWLYRARAHAVKHLTPVARNPTIPSEIEL